MTTRRGSRNRVSLHCGDEMKTQLATWRMLYANAQSGYAPLDEPGPTLDVFGGYIDRAASWLLTASGAREWQVGEWVRTVGTDEYGQIQTVGETHLNIRFPRATCDSFDNIAKSSVVPCEVAMCYFCSDMKPTTSVVKRVLPDGRAEKVCETCAARFGMRDDDGDAGQTELVPV